MDKDIKDTLLRIEELLKALLNTYQPHYRLPPRQGYMPGVFPVWAEPSYHLGLGGIAYGKEE